jgi:hypothetical protein
VQKREYPDMLSQCERSKNQPPQFQQAVNRNYAQFVPAIK